MSSIPQLPSLPGLDALPSLVNEAAAQAGSQTSAAGAFGRGVLDALAGVDPVTSAASNLALRGVFIIGGLALVLIGFFMFRQVQTVVKLGAKVAGKAAVAA